MAIIQEFFYQFIADNEELIKGSKESEEAVRKSNKGIEQSTKSTGDTITRINQQTAQASIKEINKVSDAWSEVKSALLQVASVAGLKAMVASLSNYAGAIDDVAARTGSSTDAIQTWIQTVGMQGGNLESTVSALDRYNMAMENQSELLQELGVSASDPIDSLVQLSGVLDDMNASSRQATLKKLGIVDKSTIKLLLQGKQSLQELMEQQSKQLVLTDEMREAGGRYDEALSATGIALDKTFNESKLVVMKAFTNLLEGATNILNRLAPYAKQIAVVFTVMATGLGLMSAKSGIVGKLFKLLVGFLPPIRGLRIAIGAITAAFALFGATGKDTISSLSKDFPNIARWLESINNWLDSVADSPTWGSIMQAIADLPYTLEYAFWRMMFMVEDAITYWSDAWNNNSESIKDGWKKTTDVMWYLWDNTIGLVIRKWLEWAQLVGKGIKGVIDFGVGLFSNDTPSTQGIKMSENRLKAVDTTSNQLSQQGTINRQAINQTNENTFNIYSQSSDPSKVADAVAGKQVSVSNHSAGQIGRNVQGVVP